MSCPEIAFEERRRKEERTEGDLPKTKIAFQATRSLTTRQKVLPLGNSVGTSAAVIDSLFMEPVSHLRFGLPTRAHGHRARVPPKEILSSPKK